jgi:hypothetical protein
VCHVQRQASPRVKSRHNAGWFIPCIGHKADAVKEEEDPGLLWNIGFREMQSQVRPAPVCRAHDLADYFTVAVVMEPVNHDSVESADALDGLAYCMAVIAQSSPGLKT